jgi:hypothetical protein
MKKAILSPNEMRLACQHGAERYISARARQAKQYSVLDLSQSRGSIDFMSSMAEMATAKGLNLYWSGVEGIGCPDVGGRIEVRSTTIPKGCLIIAEKDNDNQIVVLTICEPPSFTIVGWILAGKAKLRDDWILKSERGQCWMVPQSELENIDALKIEQAPSVGEDEWMLDL